MQYICIGAPNLFLALGLILPTCEAERSPVRFHLHKGRTLSLRKWLKPIVVAICAPSQSTKEALPSSLQIKAFYVSTFYTRDFHLVLSPWTLSIFYVVARMWPLQCFESSGRRLAARVACLNYFQMFVLAWEYSWQFQLQKYLLKDFSACLTCKKLFAVCYVTNSTCWPSKIKHWV